jgi:hypothetical protein
VMLRSPRSITFHVIYTTRANFNIVAIDLSYLEYMVAFPKATPKVK